MDNIRVSRFKEKIHIEKGFMKRKYLYTYYLFLIFLIILLFVLDSTNKLDDISQLYISNSIVKFIFHFVFFITIILFFPLTIFFVLPICWAMYFERIILDTNIKICSLFYEKELEYSFLKEIIVYPYFRYTSIRGINGSFRGSFKDKCTVILITKDDKEYEWGFNLSYQKGIEIKQMIEERIKLGCINYKEINFL